MKGAHARTELVLDDSQDSNETSDDSEDNGSSSHVFTNFEFANLRFFFSRNRLYYFFITR